MANGGLAALGIMMVVMVLGALAVGVYALQSGVLTNLKDIPNWISDYFKNLNGGGGGGSSPSPSPTPRSSASPSPSPTSGGGNAAAQAWYGFKLYFSDGNSQELNMNPTLSIFPMSIQWYGKNITHIDIFERLKVSGSNLGSWSAHSTQHIEIYFNGATVPPETGSSTGYFDNQGSSWASGSTKTILTTTISADRLNSLFNEYGSGNWVFQTTGTIALTIQSNGLTQQLSADMGQNDLDFVSTASIFGTATVHAPVVNLK